MKLLITRPEQDARTLTQKLKAKGHEVILNPLIDIEFSKSGADQLQDQGFDDFDGLIFTSANGVRAFAHFFLWRNMPVWAVGEATARAAREAGFEKIIVGGGDVDVLSDLIRDQAKPHSRFLHVAANKLAGDLKSRLLGDGFGYERSILYISKKRQRLDRAVIQQIEANEIQGVLFYSPRTASSFADSVRLCRLERPIKNMVAYGLSAAVVAKIESLGWKGIKIAASPTQDALLELL